jgi:hypothetical protein
MECRLIVIEGRPKGLLQADKRPSRSLPLEIRTWGAHWPSMICDVPSVENAPATFRLEGRGPSTTQDLHFVKFLLRSG